MIPEKGYSIMISDFIFFRGWIRSLLSLVGLIRWRYPKAGLLYPHTSKVHLFYLEALCIAFPGDLQVLLDHPYSPIRVHILMRKYKVDIIVLIRLKDGRPIIILYEEGTSMTIYLTFISFAWSFSTNVILRVNTPLLVYVLLEI